MTKARSHGVTDNTIASGAVDSGSIPLESVPLSLEVFMGKVIIIIAIIALSVLLRSFSERRSLVARHYSFVNAFAPQAMRLAFLTDIHDRLQPRDIDIITKTVGDKAPDLILIGGDAITLGRRQKTPPSPSPTLRLLEALAAIAPVVYAEGNHEQRLEERFPEVFKSLREGLDALGITYLKDGSRAFGSVVISSASLPMEAYDRRFPSIGDSGRKYPLSQGYLEARLGSAPKDRYNILLLHNPLYLKEAHEWGADLVLSGHFHGGTVRLPLLGGLMTTQYQFFLRETAGSFRIDSTTMIVSPGIGTHAVRLRLFNLPEISVIDIMGNDDRRAALQN